MSAENHQKAEEILKLIMSPGTKSEEENEEIDKKIDALDPDELGNDRKAMDYTFETANKFMQAIQYSSSPNPQFQDAYELFRITTLRIRLMGFVHAQDL